MGSEMGGMRRQVSGSQQVLLKLEHTCLHACKHYPNAWPVLQLVVGVCDKMNLSLLHSIIIIAIVWYMYLLQCQTVHVRPDDLAAL